MPPSILDRKTPSNPKYANVKSTLNTGANTLKIAERYKGTSGAFAHKRPADEFFVKLRPSTLGELVEPLADSEESIYQLGHDNDGVSVIAQSVVPDSVAASAAGEGNLLILDLRPFEEFERGHVYGARHYDVAQLSKATNNFPREVYFYRGPVGCDKMVVLYDADGGRTARDAGNAFVQKGIENTYVVGDGFLGLCSACPHVLVGYAPAGDELVALRTRAGLKPVGGSGASVCGAMSSRCSTAGSVRTQRTNLTGFGGGGSVAGSMSARAWK